MLKMEKQDYNVLFAPLFERPSRSVWLAAGALLLVLAAGLALYVRQLLVGLGVTNMGRPVFWGMYIVNFIFLIGVSMAGTLISASLHLLKVEWRRPLTRIAETLTVIGLIVAGLQIIIDMGRPERALFLGIYGRWQSPLVWDATSLTLYILASLTALYLDLLPDLGLLRDNLPAGAPGWRKKLYSLLALDWSGSREQWRRHEKAMSVLSVLIIPIGVSLHTITSWLLSTTVQPGWKSTILGPYFVVGAIYSGIGLLVILVSIIRKWRKLETYITPRHYQNMGWFFIVMNLVWFYFTISEVVPLLAEQEAIEFPVLASKLWGEFALPFWGMVVLMLVAFWVTAAPKIFPAKSSNQPLALFGLVLTALGLAAFFLNLSPLVVTLAGAAFLIGLLLWGIGSLGWLRANPIPALLTASACAVIGMWLERYNILIPTLTHPRLIPFATYFPTLTEIGLSLASLALMGLMYLGFFLLFPAVTHWEVAGGGEQ